MFTALPRCCPLPRTPFSNHVCMCTRSLVPGPKTTVIGLGAKLVHTRYCVLTSIGVRLARSLPVVVGKAHGHHVGKVLHSVVYL